MTVRICVLYLIICINSKLWPICHCLGLGHETMVCAVCLYIFLLTNCRQWDLGENLGKLFSSLLQYSIDVVCIVQLLPNECQWTILMISEHWLMQRLCAVKQKAITWAKVDQDHNCNMMPLGYNELKHDNPHSLCSVGDGIQLGRQTKAEHCDRMHLMGTCMYWNWYNLKFGCRWHSLVVLS